MKLQDTDARLKLMLEALSLDLQGELEQIDARLRTAACPLAELTRRDAMKRAYIQGFACLALGRCDVDEVMEWLRGLHESFPAPPPRHLH
ncbi:hypothetical protein [Noviherbaspirillum galbum]|uniref:Uncharacterized protein n=1 Tax=Noviherbaspirillum galbum TaxID=2709383 RepID=A0A6B3SGB6_9BURK|nr:hypothetical protein [Noviherbaspirillum galbum]NEX59670.1 hypothetical protein [Noviherbaspirillum galbum]